MEIKKKMKRFTTLLAAVVLMASLIPATALAEETEDADSSTSSTLTYLTISDTDKTITVTDDESVTTEIQDAINYIYNTYASDINADEQSSNQTGKTVDTSSGQEDGWTIIVNEGTYGRFTVHSYLDSLTIKAADGAEVTITVLDGSSSPATSSGSYPDVGGVSVRIADSVTLDGLTFSSSGNTSGVTTNYNWLASAVSDFVETTEKASNFVIKNCTFKGSGSEIGIMIAGATAWSIDNCTFDNFSSAISFMLDNTYTQASITNNTITNCSDAILESYAGGSVSDGTSAYLTVTGNTIKGTASVHTRVCIMNEYSGRDSLGTVTISGNTFEHANILLDCIDTTASAIYENNTVGECSWVMVTAMGHGTVSDDAKEVAFVASTTSGYWELISEDGISEDDLSYIKELIATANENDSTTLTIDMTELNLEGSSLKGYLSGGVKYLKTVVNWVSTTSVTVTKIWDDSDDADELRPESVTVALYADDAATGETITLSEKNNWSTSFTGLDIHDSEGNTIAYSIIETAVDGYATAYSNLTGNAVSGYAITITNTHEATETEEEEDETEEPEDETKTTEAQTGDSGILFWAILMGAALLCIVVIIRRKKIAK